jgi:hypothetical protein
LFEFLRKKKNKIKPIPGGIQTGATKLIKLQAKCAPPDQPTLYNSSISQKQYLNNI